MATWLLTDKKPFVERSYFATVDASYAAKTVDTFLDQLSLDAASIKRFLELEDKKIRSFEFKLFEQTPFRKRPLFRIATRYLCYSPNVLHASLSSTIYDVLKEYDPGPFAENFGKSFEKYVRLGLNYSGIPYVDENGLRREFSAEPVVDFLLPFLDCNVLIESKAVEMSPLARVSPDPGVVGRSLKDSVISAVQQGLSLASALADDKISIPCVNNRPQDTFLLVVTFKDLHIGSGRTFLRGTNRDEIDNHLAAKGVTAQFPYEHIYFMSIAEFEWITELVRTQQISIPTFLRKVVKTDETGGRKFQIGATPTIGIRQHQTSSICSRQL